MSTDAGSAAALLNRLQRAKLYVSPDTNLGSGSNVDARRFISNTIADAIAALTTPQPLDGGREKQIAEKVIEKFEKYLESIAYPYNGELRDFLDDANAALAGFGVIESALSNPKPEE